MPAQAPDLQPGQLVPGTKYRIVQQLGAGGMGVVYQVVKPPAIQGVLKLMSSSLAGHPEFRAKFLDEVRVLAQLDHPNIVKVFDYDTLPDGTPFYVMELLYGQTVRDALATLGALPARVAFEVTRQLCEALQCAHTHDVPVVHRDIKPENIFLHAPRHGEPHVKLIDFGVVAFTDRPFDGSFVGTWKYAAPEQIRGDRPTPASDLYAVGLVLYEMLCGVGPFDHLGSSQRVAQAHLDDEPAPVSHFAPWVPPSIVALVSSALAKNPADRPSTAYAFAEQLYDLEWAIDSERPLEPTTEGHLSRILTSAGPKRPMLAKASPDKPSAEPQPPAEPKANQPSSPSGSGTPGIFFVPDASDLPKASRVASSSEPKAPIVPSAPNGDAASALAQVAAQPDPTPATAPAASRNAVLAHAEAPAPAPQAAPLFPHPAAPAFSAPAARAPGRPASLLPPRPARTPGEDTLLAGLNAPSDIDSFGRGAAMRYANARLGNSGHAAAGFDPGLFGSGGSQSSSGRELPYGYALTPDRAQPNRQKPESVPAPQPMARRLQRFGSAIALIICAGVGAALASAAITRAAQRALQSNVTPAASSAPHAADDESKNSRARVTESTSPGAASPPSLPPLVLEGQAPPVARPLGAPSEPTTANTPNATAESAASNQSPRAAPTPAAAQGQAPDREPPATASALPPGPGPSSSSPARIPTSATTPPPKPAATPTSPGTVPTKRRDDSFIRGF